MLWSFVTSHVETPHLVALEIFESVSRSGESHELEHLAGNAEIENLNPSPVDITLLSPVTPTLPVSVDQMMGAVEGVRRYVISHLARIGRSCDVDDVMQDIRMAVWDGGGTRKLPTDSWSSVRGPGCKA